MAPIAVEAQNGSQIPYEQQNGHKAVNGKPSTHTVKLPLEPNGSLDSYNRIDLTPVIGREFPTADLVDMMNAPNSDELLTELALTSMADSFRDNSYRLINCSLSTRRCLVPEAGQLDQ